jgi:hypothetical protein
MVAAMPKETLTIGATAVHAPSYWVNKQAQLPRTIDSVFTEVPRTDAIVVLEVEKLRAVILKPQIRRVCPHFRILRGSLHVSVHIGLFA